MERERKSRGTERESKFAAAAAASTGHYGVARRAENSFETLLRLFMSIKEAQRKKQHYNFEFMVPRLLTGRPGADTAVAKSSKLCCFIQWEERKKSFIS